MRFEKFLWLVLVLVVLNFFGGSVISREEIKLPPLSTWYGFYRVSTKPGNWCLAHKVNTQELVLFRPADGPVEGDAAWIECTEFVPVLAWWDFKYSEYKLKEKK